MVYTITRKDPENGKDIAFLEFKLQPGIECEIYDIMVEKEFRRQGIARELLQELLETVVSSSTPFVFLEVAEGNIAAINLYKSFGFKQIAKRRKYYNNKQDALVMRCDVIIDT